jgi:hypothetical protein
MNLYIKLSVCVPRLIPGRGFYAQISLEITSEFPGVTRTQAKKPVTPAAKKPQDAPKTKND